MCVACSFDVFDTRHHSGCTDTWPHAIEILHRAVYFAGDNGEAVSVARSFDAQSMIFSFRFPLDNRVCASTKQLSMSDLAGSRDVIAPQMKVAAFRLSICPYDRYMKRAAHVLTPGSIMSIKRPA